MVNAKSILKGLAASDTSGATAAAAATSTSRAGSARTGSRGSGTSVTNMEKITAWKSNRDVVWRGRCHHLRPFPPNLHQTSGNALLRRLVKSQQLAYNGTTSKARKSEIVQAIFDQILQQQGRFLQLESLPPTPTPTANTTKKKQRKSRRSSSAKLPFQFTVMDRDAAMNNIRQALRDVKIKAGSIVTGPYSPLDVLLGSSGLESCRYADYTDHPGNAHFWRVVQEHWDEYSAAVAHGNAMLQDEIVNHVIGKQRGRFLQRIKASSLTKAEIWVRMDSGSIATMVQFALRSRPATTTTTARLSSKHATAAVAPSCTVTAATAATADQHLKLIGQVDKFDIFRVVLTVSATAAFHLLQQGLGMSVVETNGLSADRLALFPRFATSCAYINDVGYGSLAQQMGLVRHDVLCWVEYTGGMISSHTAGQPLVNLFGGQAVIQLWSRLMFEEHCRRWRKGDDFFFYIVRQRRMPMQQSPCMPFRSAILGFPPYCSRPTERSLVVDALIAELHGNEMA